MQIRPSAFGLEILAPAKVNLFFEVLSRRDDGFHEIETLMLPLGVYDTLFAEDDDSGEITIAPRWSMGLAHVRIAARSADVAASFGDVPTGDENLAVRAVRLLAERAGVKRGLRMRLIKRIPAAAGLGGGSSDAAAALAAANQIWKLGWPRRQLSAVAAEIGSDVPFFLAGGPAVCRGRGEKIERIDGLGRLNLVLIRPLAGLSTAAVYRGCRPSRHPLPCGPVIEAVRRNNWVACGPVAHNRLLEPARSQCPSIERLLSRLRKESCALIGMSGSGTTCFAVCRTDWHARSVAARLRADQGSACWVCATCAV